MRAALVTNVARNLKGWSRVVAGPKFTGYLSSNVCVSRESRCVMATYSIVERGSLYSPSYKAYFVGPQGFISPFHDIPLHANVEKTVFNMVVEIPRWTNAKMEISREDKLNPIKQDVKKGKMRFVDNCFPHHGYIWNYGALPQTWEDPNHIDAHTSQKGDNDPIDVCEIGSTVFNRGDVIQVKVLGIIALIDEGETDWKVLAVNVNDPLATSLNDISDVEKRMPGYLALTRDWFRIYKMPTGKPPNQFAFDGKARNKQFALEIIEQTHEQWQQLVRKQTDGGPLVCENTTLKDTPFIIRHDAAQAIVDANPPASDAASLPSTVDKWHYVNPSIASSL